MLKLSKIFQFVWKTMLLAILLLCWGWGSFALYLSGPGPQWIKGLVTCLFVILLPGSFFLLQSYYRSIAACIGVFLLLLLWWGTLKPTNDRDWAVDVEKISHGRIANNILTIHNVRSFDYKDEMSPIPKWVERQYDMAKLQGLDIFLSYWASEHIAHTILSWDFGDDGHLAISIETRKDKTQEYSAVKGFFKQFGLSYVAADEHDIIRLRTNFRKERVYLYPLKGELSQAKKLLENYLEEMNLLVTEPKFYNALTRNCTTTIQIHADAARIDGKPPFDWRLIFSGHADAMLYDRGGINQTIPFKELRERSRIDPKAQTYEGADYSRFIRQDLPVPKR